MLNTIIRRDKLVIWELITLVSQPSSSIRLDSRLGQIDGLVWSIWCGRLVWSGWCGRSENFLSRYIKRNYKILQIRIIINKHTIRILCNHYILLFKEFNSESIVTSLYEFSNRKSTPRPGIEPGPPGWKPGILTPRPSGTCS